MSRPFCIRGATGNCAKYIEGTFHPTSELSGGWPVFEKHGNADHIIYFSTSVDKWILTTRGIKSPGKSTGFAFVLHRSSLKSCPLSSKWEVTVGGTIVEQPQVRLHAASPPVCIRGAKGNCAKCIEGTFHPTSELSGGCDCWLSQTLSHASFLC
jgi:hypothetical protein